MNYMSIPQVAGAREQQMLAISSIPTYCMYSTTMLVIVPTGSCCGLQHNVSQLFSNLSIEFADRMENNCH